MTILRLLCFIGLHPRKGWEFVGSSWQPDLYIRVCVECGRQVYDNTPAPSTLTIEIQPDIAGLKRLLAGRTTPTLEPGELFTHNDADRPIPMLGVTQ